MRKRPGKRQRTKMNIRRHTTRKRNIMRKRKRKITQNEIYI